MKLATPHRMIMTPTATRLLADRTYDIEFHGYLSNHAKHAIIALDRIGATEARTQEYWDTYTAMTPYNLQLHKVDQAWESVQPCTLDQWKEWRGNKLHWQEQVALVQQQLQAKHKGDTDALIADMAPDLLASPCLAGALTHGIIHLGWAIDAQSPWMITEGLAYLNFGAVGVDPEVIQMDVHKEESPMDTLIRAAKAWDEENLKEAWIDKVKKENDKKDFHPELVEAGFQREVAKVFVSPHPIARDMPTWLTTMKLPDLFEALYRTTVRLYLATRDENGNGNFLILHLTTSLWGLEHVLQSVSKHKSSAEYDAIARKAIAQWWANVICFVGTSGDGFPPASALQRNQEGAYADSNNDAADLDWSAVIEKGKAETEEHNIKLVYVTRDLWHRYGYWHPFFEAANAFTVTPDIGPDTPQYDA